MLHKVNLTSPTCDTLSILHNKNAFNLKLTILERSIGDPRTCSAPSVPEITVLIPGEGYPERVANRDIVLYA